MKFLSIPSCYYVIALSCEIFVQKHQQNHINIVFFIRKIFPYFIQTLYTEESVVYKFCNQCWRSFERAHVYNINMIHNNFKWLIWCPDYKKYNKELHQICKLHIVVLFEICHKHDKIFCRKHKPSWNNVESTSW